ncbi:cyclin-dependent kinase inhibitor 1 [Zea mays]|uniref:Cyclin-dependent kinase inhibitor n=1 Tax=Zea mays TaxID=4577 RepID=B4F986_MAIZE|nr:cyclin-dependent kinase inhibitor 1 [Zea mays]ACF78679.1 unknown [Zea mays]ACF87752.1 unknown [Zea mays]ONM05945.1 cyclin-dependent kinase inhibitor1 [Zea mays]|eukprot:NP_001105778.2 cyclin-dependent kinase inhibitor 1 [Zea mays]
MGKYMRKAKASSEVVIMDVAAAPLGVRTRARALALQRLQEQQTQWEEGAGGEYLELRNRRLEKLPPPPATTRRSGGRKAAAEAAATKEAEASYGENMLELEAMERITRETTPCSLINTQMTSTPGSTRSGHSCHRRVNAPPVHAVPSSREMNEYFAAEQRRQQQDFIDKYNFDPANDCPLPGRFEWVKLD